MKRLISTFLKVITSLFIVVVSYFLVALVFSSIPASTQEIPNNNQLKTVYLTTNGVHLDFVLPVNLLGSELLFGLELNNQTNYVAFGWGDENFYLNTPTWSDLTVENAVRALFLESSTLMHVTYYSNLRSNWSRVDLSESQLNQLNTYIAQTFQLNSFGQKQRILNSGYTKYDSFYKANGSYSCFKTCNTWVNFGLKQSGLPACVWTPFDFAVLKYYKE